MQQSDPAHEAAAILSRCQYGNIATIGTDGPWNTPVTVMADANLNLYWASWIDARHSRNIRRDGRIAITFYDSTRQRGTNHHGCLYVQAHAREVLSRPEGAKAHELIYPDVEADLGGFFDGGPRRFYCAVPEAAWLNDLSEREVTADTTIMRLEVALNALGEALAELRAD